MENFIQNKSNMGQAIVLGIMSFFLIFWFPVNLVFVSLLTKAYDRDSTNILQSFITVSTECFYYWMGLAIEFYNNYKSNKLNPLNEDPKWEENEPAKKEK
jgi:hypothetical protein